MRNVTFIMGKPEKTLLKYDNRKKNNNKTIKHVKMRKHNVTTTGNSREQETKWKTKNEQMRKSHIYFFHNNLHFVNKTCWIMMIMAFGILMLGLYDLQVRRVLRYDQNQDERRCKK